MQNTMKHLLRLLPVAALALLLSTANAAQAQSHEHSGHDHTSTSQADVLQPEIIDGVQVAHIEIGKMGYSAKNIALKEDMPVRLVFTRTVEGGCAFQIQIADLGVEATDLPINEPVAIEFTPEESGQYTFACGMDMMKGTLLVKAG